MTESPVDQPEDDTARLADLESRLGITFGNKDFLRLALVHESTMNADRAAGREGAESNERLEFLGDAVLGAAAADFLYRTYPEYPEGTLTLLRAALVRRSIATIYADDIGLGTFVRVSRVTENSEGRGLSSVRSAAFEAVVGALYLDQGFEKTFAFLQTFFTRHLPPILAQDLHRNPKSELQELTQGQHHVTPRYSIRDRTGPEHNSRFYVEVTAEGIGSALGEGVNRQLAEQAAARTLLNELRDLVVE